MNIFFFLLLTLSFNVWSLDSDILNSDFVSLAARQKVGTTSEQAYCYEEQGQVLGFQPDKLQRIASVTKLFSTLLASETSDLHKKFITRVFVGKDSLHIEGNRDPYFEEEKMLLLFQSLNKLGYTKFKKISFNQDFKFYDVALESFATITPNETRSRLQYYTNPRSATFIRNIWKGILKFAAEENVALDPTLPALQADSVVISDVNPLLNENPQVYLHVSKPFHKILKSMNVMSKNTVSQNVFDDASKIKTFSQLAAENGISSATFKIYNGSGLPMISPTSRLDNTATCRTVLKTIKLLLKSLSRHNLDITDVVAVSGGKDLGTFRERFKLDPLTDEAVSGKTGTLKHTSALAGILFFAQKIPFAILNHSTNALGARKFQDLFVSRMFHHLGMAVPVGYEKISTFPWVEKDFLVLSQ